MNASFIAKQNMLILWDAAAYAESEFKKMLTMRNLPLRLDYCISELADARAEVSAGSKIEHEL